jgi:hypothetical protein
MQLSPGIKPVWMMTAPRYGSATWMIHSRAMKNRTIGTRAGNDPSLALSRLLTLDVVSAVAEVTHFERTDMLVVTSDRHRGTFAQYFTGKARTQQGSGVVSSSGSCSALTQCPYQRSSMFEVRMIQLRIYH